MQVIYVRSFIASANASFEGPVVSAIPNQISARTKVPTKRFVVVVTGAKCQGKGVEDTPFVFREYCFCSLLEVFAR